MKTWGLVSLVISSSTSSSAYIIVFSDSDSSDETISNSGPFPTF